LTQTISIKSWERFQHYKDRDPPWIKLYRDLLTAESWVLGTDDSRLVQVACILLAARYQNATPLNFPLFRKVASLDLSAKEFHAALSHLAATDFLEIQGVADTRKQSASGALATCTSETEQSRDRAEQRVPTEPCPAERDLGAAERVFDHWRSVHDHPRAKLDDKRRKVIAGALKNYTADEICESISGYRNSPHHMGQNDRATRYDDIELFLRDAKHIDQGLAFSRGPVATVSKLTLRNVAATADWTPPEVRNATR
jgi:hypothetical protein